ncbi:hypothetical protein QUF72_21695 [Desulfobacterales bacterium HSG2]|nr:hypothetical protein [Desulfobacterales bacterium HSG2]
MPKVIDSSENPPDLAIRREHNRGTDLLIREHNRGMPKVIGRSEKPTRRIWQSGGSITEGRIC